MALSKSSRPKHELAHIITQYEPDFLKQNTVLKHHQRVLNALKICRTSALGGHIDQCGDCNYTRVSYNSCRNRHCPKCQNTAKEQWIIDRESELLPCKYFHLVFTIPQEINAYCLKHPKALYDILFESSKQTLEAFGNDKKYMGGQMGFISLLHTWGQNLSLHPHVHVILPGLCLTDAGFWKSANKSSNYLFPAKAMAIVFRNKFMEKLLLFLKSKNQSLTNALRQNLYAKNWVVFAKTPFAGPEQVIEYLGRYTHKIAISNHRILSIEKGKIVFKYKDYADQGKQKVMTLEANEFLRRFCMHILPPGYRKIRHYGFLSSRAKFKLKQYQFQKGMIKQLKKNKGKKEKTSWKELSKTKLGYDPDACPCCKTGRMHTLFAFEANAPPLFIENLKKRLNIKN